MWLSPGQGHRAHCHLQAPEGAKLAATLPGSLLAPQIHQKSSHPEGFPPPLEQGTQGGAAPLVFCPKVPKKRGGISLLHSLHPSRPLLTRGSSTHDIHGPKAPLGGQCLVCQSFPRQGQTAAGITPALPSFPGALPSAPSRGHRARGQQSQN